jgi:hypothetical protein
MSVRLGDVPGWLAWMTTFGVLVVALYQIATERHRRHEAEEKEAEERLLAQARLISAFPGAAEPQPSGAGWRNVHSSASIRFPPTRSDSDRRPYKSSSASSSAASSPRWRACRRWRADVPPQMPPSSLR